LKWQSRAPWDGKRDRYALALATGRSILAASVEAAISQRTAERWAKDPEILARVAELRVRLVDTAIGKAADALCQAVEVMVECLSEENPNVRLRAAEAIRDSLVRLREHVGFDERLLRVEASLAASVDQTAGNGRANGQAESED
jgi:hypothetical protein